MPGHRIFLTSDQGMLALGSDLASSARFFNSSSRASSSRSPKSSGKLPRRASAIAMRSDSGSAKADSNTDFAVTVIDRSPQPIVHPNLDERRAIDENSVFQRRSDTTP